MAKHVIGIDKNTKEVKYDFPSLADAARYFSEKDNKNFLYKKSTISSVVCGKKKTYKGCYWKVV